MLPKTHFFAQSEHFESSPEDHPMAKILESGDRQAIAKAYAIMLCAAVESVSTIEFHKALDNSYKGRGDLIRECVKENMAHLPMCGKINANVNFLYAPFIGDAWGDTIENCTSIRRIASDEWEMIAAQLILGQEKLKKMLLMCSKSAPGCKDSKKGTEMPELKQKRDFDALCVRSAQNNKYTNADDWGKLFPEYEWSVPERRAPVCVSTAPCTVNASQFQTALIGTLLQEAHDTGTGSIMPKFDYTEYC